MNELFNDYRKALMERQGRGLLRSHHMRVDVAMREVSDTIKYLISAQEAFQKDETNVAIEYMEMIPNWLREGNWRAIKKGLL